MSGRGVDLFGSGPWAGSCEVTKKPLDSIKIANFLPSDLHKLFKKEPVPLSYNL
jgi:hypothetical protein